MKKKLIALALVAALGGGVVCTGCTMGPPDQGDASIDVDKNITATLNVAITDKDEEENLIKSVAVEFNKEYKNVTVKPMRFSNGTFSYMQSAIKKQEKDRPDIVIATSFEMFQLMNSNVIVNIQPYIDAETKANQFNINDFYSTFFKAGQKDFNGDQYLIPRSADRVVCHYNVSIINAANEWYQSSNLYDADKCENLSDLIVNGWTWEDFDFVCSAIRGYYDSKNERNRYILDGNFDWEAVWNPIFDSYGVEYIGQDKSILIDSQNTKDALQFMKTLATKRYTSTTSAQFYGGKGAFLFQSQSAKEALAQVGENAINIEGGGATYKELYDAGRYTEFYNCVTVPVKKDAERIGSGVAGYCIVRGSKKADVAWKFLKTLMSQEGQNAISKNSKLNYVPIRTDMSDASQWAWGTGLNGINLSAYTYKAGGNDEDWGCFTDFFLPKPSQAKNLIDDVTTMVNSYVFDVSNPDLQTVIDNCERSMTGRMQLL